jgi:hypothetical protein
MEWNRHVMMEKARQEGSVRRQVEKWGWQSVNIISQIEAVDLKSPICQHS